jgi:hypothetical protein
LARLCSTTELFPRSKDGAYSMLFIIYVKHLNKKKLKTLYQQVPAEN